MTTAARHDRLFSRDPVRIQVDCPVHVQDEGAGFSGEGRCLYLSTHSVVFTIDHVPLMGTRLQIQLKPSRPISVPLNAIVSVRRVESSVDTPLQRITASIEQVLA